MSAALSPIRPATARDGPRGPEGFCAATANRRRYPRPLFRPVVVYGPAVPDPKEETTPAPGCVKFLVLNLVPTDMPLTQIEGEAGKQIVRFRAGGGAEKERKRLKLILKVLIVFAIASMVDLMSWALPFLDFFTIVGNDILLDSTATAEEQDVGRLFNSIATVGILALTAVIIYIPTRYFLLHRRVDRGHPSTWLALRRIASVQLSIEVTKLLVWMMLVSDLQVLELQYFGGLNLIFAPALLYYLTRPAMRAYFSAYRIEPLAATGPPSPGGQPAGASWGAVGGGPSEQWTATPVPAPDPASEPAEWKSEP
jgi:hypothetical protein